MRKRIVVVLATVGLLFCVIYLFFHPAFFKHTETVDEAVARWASVNVEKKTLSDNEVGYVEFHIYADENETLKEQKIADMHYVIICVDERPVSVQFIKIQDTEEAYIGPIPFDCTEIFDSGLSFAIISSHRAYPDWITPNYYLYTEDGSVIPLGVNLAVPSPQKRVAQEIEREIKEQAIDMTLVSPNEICSVS